MLKKIMKFLVNHIITNVHCYSFCVLFVLLGIAIGVVNGSGFNDNQFFSKFFSGLNAYSSSYYLKDAFIYAIGLSVVLLVAGLSPLGCIFIPFIALYKGFTMGYTVAALFTVYSYKALVLVLIAIIPSGFFWIPAFMFGCVSSIITSLCFVNVLRRKPINGFSEKIVQLVFSVTVMFLCVLLSKFTEIFIIPKMLNVVGGMYT